MTVVPAVSLHLASSLRLRSTSCLATRTWHTYWGMRRLPGHVLVG